MLLMFPDQQFAGGNQRDGAADKQMGDDRAPVAAEMNEDGRRRRQQTERQIDFAKGARIIAEGGDDAGADGQTGDEARRRRVVIARIAEQPWRGDKQDSNNDDDAVETRPRVRRA